jgi:hypothetical protein
MSNEYMSEPYKAAVQPCEHCGTEDEPVHAVPTGDGFLILCADCRAFVVGGS